MMKKTFYLGFMVVLSLSVYACGDIYIDPEWRYFQLTSISIADETAHVEGVSLDENGGLHKENGQIQSSSFFFSYKQIRTLLVDKESSLMFRILYKYDAGLGRFVPSQYSQVEILTPSPSEYNSWKEFIENSDKGPRQKNSSQ